MVLVREMLDPDEKRELILEATSGNISSNFPYCVKEEWFANLHITRGNWFAKTGGEFGPALHVSYFRTLAKAQEYFDQRKAEFEADND